MNDEVFNLSIRKFLKEFGVGAQREIEQAVQAALRTGALTGTDTIKATATLRIGQVDLEFTTEGDLSLS